METETNAQILRKAIARFDNPGLNHDLPHRHIHFGNHIPNVIQTSRRILDEQHVRAIVEQSTASLRKQSLFWVKQQFLHIRALDVIHLEAFGTQGLQITNLNLRLEIKFFLGGNLITRSNQNDIPVLAHIQPLLLQDNVKRLIPRDILQNQRNSATYRVADYHIHSRKLANHLQQTPYFDVLEVQ